MKEIKKIEFYCGNCKKSLKMSYEVSGDAKMPIMSGITLRCHTHKCRRVMALKKYTEGQLADRADKKGNVYI